MIISRSDARAVGLTRYDTGKPCKHGHLSSRYVATGQCGDCMTVKNRRWRVVRRVWDKAHYKPRKKPSKLVSHPRIVARAAGSLTYRGKPCRLGHGTERYVSSCTCLECARISREKLLRGGARRSEMDRQVHEVQRAKRREKARKYKARRRAAGPNYSAADIVWLKERQGGKCGICLLAIGGAAWEVDHRVSLVDGGTNDRLNLHITHMLCNRSKGKRHEIEYAQERFGRLL